MDQGYRRSAAPAAKKQRQDQRRKQQQERRQRGSSGVDEGTATTREHRRQKSGDDRRAVTTTTATAQAPQLEHVSPNGGIREPFLRQVPRPTRLLDASFERACVLAPTRSGERGSTGGRAVGRLSQAAGELIIKGIFIKRSTLCYFWARAITSNI